MNQVSTPSAPASAAAAVGAEITRSQADDRAAPDSMSFLKLTSSKLWIETDSFSRADLSSLATSPYWRLTKVAPGYDRIGFQASMALKYFDRLAPSTMDRQQTPT